jgi:simple sugar transport system ATP-binding protein
MPPALELLDIAKRFGPLLALDNVTLRLAPGSVHGLLGENGAGKSTLMNVAYGLLRPDAGEIRVAGERVGRRFASPRDAIAAGIGMVHQHFMLAPAMTVLDNVLLGDRRARQFLDRRRAARSLDDLAARLGLPVDPWARVGSLSVGEQQRVEILKALWRDVRVLILDEPTAVLTPMETGQLFRAVERLRDDGKTIVFISHKLAEVRRICDRLTVLRRGMVVWEGDAKSVSSDELARHMVGHEVKLTLGAASKVILSEAKDLATNVEATLGFGEWLRASIPDASQAQHDSIRATHPILALVDVSAPGLQHVSLSIHRGEILGVAGVDGNGQQELAEIVVGLRKPARGSVFVGGEDVTRLPLKRRLLRLGVAHIPNDRKREGLIPAMNVAENIALKIHDRAPVARLGVVRGRAMRSLARRLVAQFDVRTPAIETPVATLSGGNQQKVVLARELAVVEPRLIVAMNPVRGLDVAATQFVYEQLLERRRAGCAVLLISSELDEVLALADRVAVIFNGRLTMTGFPRTSREEIGQLMAGVGS